MKQIICLFVTLLFFACSNGEKTEKVTAYPPPSGEPSTLADLHMGMPADSVILLLGQPVRKMEMGFGIYRWYYSDTSFVAITDDTVASVVQSVAAAEREIRELFQ